MARVDLEKYYAGNREETVPSHSNISSQQLSEDSNPNSAPSTNERPIHGLKWALAVTSILWVDFLFAMDNTILANVQPNILNTFGEIEKLPWVAVSYILPSAALILPWSKAYSIFNIKWLFITHVVLFEAGSALTAAAPNMNVFIIAKAMAGCGSCGMYIGSISYLTVMTAPSERPLYISIVTPIWGLGTVLGPVIGGAFAVSSATWRWGFYINLPIGALFAPFIVFLLPSKDLQSKTPFKEKLKQNDFLGIFVFIGWNISFAMAINFGGIVYPWSSPSEIVLWVMVLVLMGLFILTQKYHPFVDAKHKLYPTHLLKNWKLLNMQWQTAAACGLVQTPLYYVPLFFQFAHGESALVAALRLLPFIFMIAFFSLLSGYVMTKLGYYMPWFVFAGACTLVGNALMCTLTPGTSNTAIYGYTVLFGIGGGCTLLIPFAIAPSLVAAEDEFGAIGCVSVAQSVGNVLYIATAANIFQNVGVKYVTPLVPANMADGVRPLLAGASSALFKALSESQRAEVTAAITQSLDKVYLLLVSASAVCLILAPFLGRGKVG